MIMDNIPPEDMTVEHKKAIFNENDLNDGDYHWENDWIGNSYIRVARNLDPGMQELILPFYKIAGETNEATVKIFRVMTFQEALF